MSVPQIQVGIWQNFKKPEMRYLALTASTGTEDKIQKAIYIPLYGEYLGKPCDRPLKMFLEEVDRPDENYKGPRFRYVGPPTKEEVELIRKLPLVKDLLSLLGIKLSG